MPLTATIVKNAKPKEKLYKLYDEKGLYLLVKPGGSVFFSTINRNPKSYVFAILGAEYILNMLPRGTHDYARFIRPSELDEWARNSELSLRDITGMSYNPLTRNYKLGRDVDVNYMVHYVRSPE